MIVVGMLAAASLGLMALRGITMLLVPQSRDLFLVPLVVAIPLALAFGMAVTYAVGRGLGLYGMRTLGDYETRQRTRREVIGDADGRPATPETTIEY